MAESETAMTAAPHLMIVEGRFYGDIADEMATGAIRAIEEHNASFERIGVPGALEIPAAVSYALKSQEIGAGGPRFDGFVALGCVIRGETTHYDHVCTESIRGLQRLALDHSLAIGVGILTCENRDQAWARAATDQGDKGGVAARVCLEMLTLKDRFQLTSRR